ncbi:retrovirus-related pol polyprotein from transposon TNT 1-94 [Tanacetum coccineum]
MHVRLTLRNLQSNGFEIPLLLLAGTVRFGNDHVAVILDLEVAFRRNTCFVRNLKGVELLKGNRTTNLYTINLHDMASASPIFLMARATSTKSWLWHQWLSHPNFDTINDLARNELVIGLPKFKYHKEHLCPSCEQGKSKRASHPPKPVPNSKQRLHLLHMDLCGPMRIESINGKRALCYPKNDPEDIGKLGASSGLDLTYAPSIITTQQLTKGELDLLFKAMYDDHIGGQPSAAPRTVLAAQAPKILQTPTTTTTIADTEPTPRNSSSHATNFPNTSHDVDELKTQQQHVQHQPATIADNVPNAMFDDNTFVNPFATPSTSAAESLSSQYVDPLNMHTFYQPYPHEYQWTKDHPLEQVIRELSRPILTRNQLRSDGDMCMYTLTVITIEPKNVKKAMTDPAWIESMQEELLQFKRADHDEENTVIRSKTRLVMRGYHQHEGIDFKESFTLVARMEISGYFWHMNSHKTFTIDSNGVKKTAFLHGTLKEDVYVCQPEGFIDADHPSHVYKLKKALYGLKQAPMVWYDKLSMFLL